MCFRYVKPLKGLQFKNISYFMMEIFNGICRSALHFPRFSFVLFTSLHKSLW